MTGGTEMPPHQAARDGEEDRDQGLLLVEVDGRRCALRLDDVVEVHHMVRMSPLPQAPEAVEGVIDLRGAAVPVIDLRRRFGMPTRSAVPDDQLVVIRVGDDVRALHVDAAVDIHHAGSDDLRPPPDAVAEHAVGIVRLPDGLVVIRDVERFLSADEEAVLDAALAAFGA